MRILISGYHNPRFETITEYMERAIGLLGHELHIFDDRQHIIPGRIRRQMRWLNTVDLDVINRKLVSMAHKLQPDIALITGGHRVTASTVRALKNFGIKTILWTIDAPLDFQPILDAAPLYDCIVCQGTEAIELLNRKKINGAQWLPVACDPEYHKPIPLLPAEMERYGHDIVFAGSYYPNRASLFEKLTGFDFGIWGPGWDKLESASKLREHIKGYHTPPSEWLKIYSASKIVLAVHYQDPENVIPVYQASPRVFEALACGAFVIVDNQKDVFSLFDDEKHLVSFSDSDDLIEKITYYLAHPQKRREIANRGREEVLRNHTYVDRIKRLLSLIEGA
jgi:spore maturation protein CgeB